MHQTFFSIENWDGWAPGLTTKQDWILWAKNEKSTQEDYNIKANVDFLPPLYRRRLSQLTRASLKVAHECLLNTHEKNIQIVFASDYGEWGQSISLLKKIIVQEEVSPAKFSLSVHNTFAGLFSIINHNTEPYSSISAGEMTFEAALIDVFLRLRETKKILLVVGEEQVPHLYSDAFPNPFLPFAIALLISTEKNNFQIKIQQNKNNKKYLSVFAFLRWVLTSKKGDIINGFYRIEHQ